MDLCNDEHEEVCYTTKNCPVCEQIIKISDLEDRIYDLKEEIKELIRELKNA